MARDLPTPFLKWAGGKGQLLHELLALIPKKFGMYHETFLGGGALFFELARLGMINEPAQLGDKNAELITTFRVVKKHTTELIEELQRKHYQNDESKFYAMRELDTWHLSKVQIAARMIYLNRTGFNGMYRVNRAGDFNVPFGRYVNPTICDEENLIACASALDNAQLRVESFEEVVSRAEKGDLIYFDPPYVPVSPTANFTAFTPRGFGLDDQELLAQVFEELSARGVYVLLSNADVSWVRQRYDGFPIKQVEARRNINSKGDKRGPVPELIVMGEWAA